MRFSRIILLTTRAAVICIGLMLVQTARGQVLISLLLGDKLNTGKVEFGLDGGASFISQAGRGGTRPTFNLGFYFDIKLKSSWMFHTGVIVKSTMGGGDIPVYDLNDPSLNTLFAGGHIDRTLNYFNVPFFLKYNLPNHFYVEAGPQLGLLYQATDKFIAQVNGNELSYNVDVRKQYRALDAGAAGGIGYRLMGGNGMNLGVRYYLGLVNVSKETSGVFNRSLYLTVGIPIGAGKARAQKNNQEPK
jgi:Outer membrane protein beta-barrel domain